MSIIDELVTDRTKADVERVALLEYLIATGHATAAEISEWMADLKGAYNASDLNRVGKAMQYINNRLLAAGYGHEIKDIKNDWQESDYIDSENLKYYLRSLALLRGRFCTTADAPPTPIRLGRTGEGSGIGFEEANDIEKILIDIDELITKMQQNYIYSGELYAGEV